MSFLRLVCVCGPLALLTIAGCGGHVEPELGGATSNASSGDGGGAAVSEGGAPGADGSAAGDRDGSDGSDDAAPTQGACFASDGAVNPVARQCLTDADCAITTHGECCGARFADGINRAYGPVYSQCEKAASDACGARKCVTGPTYAEDGRPVTDGRLRVRCASKTCRTSVN